MKNQFSKVGQIKPSFKRFLKIEELQNIYKSFIEEAYNVMQTDSGLSDYLYFEASKLKKQMIRVETNNRFPSAF